MCDNLFNDKLFHNPIGKAHHDDRYTVKQPINFTQNTAGFYILAKIQWLPVQSQ